MFLLTLELSLKAFDLFGAILLLVLVVKITYFDLGCFSLGLLHLNRPSYELFGECNALPILLRDK